MSVPKVSTANCLVGVDSIRFVAAAVVALGHGAMVPLRQLTGEQGGLLGWMASIHELAFNGPAAVMVFFVISGVCIHYPYAQGRRFHALEFLTRRLLRVSLPLLVAALIAIGLGPAAWGALRVVLWSLYCEMVYYAVYPMLRPIIWRFTLGRCVVVSGALAAVLVLFHWRLSYHWELPVWAMVLVCMPPWLLGCRLAERLCALPQRAPAGMLWWRLTVWGLSCLALVLFYHGGIRIGHPALLLGFCFFAAVWLEREARHFMVAPPSRTLEWCGRWSYSLYLVHNVVLSTTALDGAGPMLLWGARLSLIVAGSLGFYFLVERPAYELARWLSGRVSRSKCGASGLHLGASTASSAVHQSS